MKTIRDVARCAGVSPATVSRVLNDKGYVSEEKKKKIEKVITEMGFEPNQVARGLAKKTSNTLALIVSDITNPFFPELAKGAEQVALSNGYTLMLGNTKGADNKPNDYTKILMNKYIDGIIIATHDIDSQLLKKYSNMPMAILEMENDVENACTIKVENVHGSVLATEHLISQGCKKIAHIYGPLYDQTSKERLQGYQKVISMHSDYEEVTIQSDFTIDGGINAVDQLLHKYPDIDGLFVGNDLMAVGVIKELNRLSIRVPDEIAVCGFDGIYLTRIVNPEITTIEQPIYKMGEIAAEKLIDRINNPHLNRECIVLDVKLRVRQSSKKSKQNTIF
ncbi:LacI family DNA-binding transcriptional regulator [Sporolactobacillus terrae]|uniref:LacI family DNA-binding transcriptional regulator n=1 Tax=Sporolactobacillus terrae TaxID=269673 RepID=UPI00111A3454|nr:LacI family DNA-binding transcriptional regulator [Sporolactobacillus terrae]